MFADNFLYKCLYHTVHTHKGPQVHKVHMIKHFGVFHLVLAKVKPLPIQQNSSTDNYNLIYL